MICFDEFLDITDAMILRHRSRRAVQNGGPWVTPQHRATLDGPATAARARSRRYRSPAAKFWIDVDSGVDASACACQQVVVHRSVGEQGGWRSFGPWTLTSAAPGAHEALTIELQNGARPRRWAGSPKVSRHARNK